MKYLSFNAYKSLQEGKLIFNDSKLILFFEYLHYFILIFSPLFLSIAFLYIQIDFQNLLLLTISILALILSVFFTLFIYYQFKKSVRFREITSCDKRKENMELVELICYWNNWKILAKDNHSHVIKIEDSKIAYHSGQELFIVYKDDKIYLRCLTYAMHDLINPFHCKSQKNIENTIIQKIKTK